jgi:alpha-tubulin suppressor-like RCC1 family protein
MKRIRMKLLSYFLVCMVLCVTCSGLPVSAASAPTTTAIGCGPIHGMASKSNDTVSAWGWSDNNQLNITQVTGKVTQLAGNMYTSLALVDNGDLWECGTSLDLYSPLLYNHPAPVKVLSGVKSIAPGGSDALHSTVLGNDGMVYTWGYNYNGVLGNGTTTDRDGSKANQADPQPVKSDSDGETFNEVQAVAQGYMYTLALKRNNTVWAWGKNQLRPAQVKKADGTFLKDVKYIATGNYTSYAIENNGTLWYWKNGETPAPINIGLSNIKAISCSHYTPIALTEDGKVYTWQIAADPSWQQPATNVNGLPEVVTAIASGGMFGYSDSFMILDNTGTAWAWGNNTCGQLGDGTQNSRTTPDKTTPVKVIY